MEQQSRPIQRIPGWAVPAGLILLVAALYAQTAGFEFVNFDDPLYVSRNIPVHLGITWAGIKAALSAVVSANWLPVTLLTHMFDAQVYGLEAGMPHLENAALHAASAVLLFLLLRRATGAYWPSAFCATIFAAHPLHVESVAWISERKDVLSTFFMFLALYAYVLYAETGRLRDYLAMAAAFALGLMSKPMLVTFPFVLLLLDFWPLRRLSWPESVLEKIPLFGLSSISAVIAYRVQDQSGAVAAFVPYDTRIAKSLLSYITYLRQTFWPVNLAVFYPYPLKILALTAGAALLILIAITTFTMLRWRTRPYLAIGWFWYLGTLVPVIGLVTIGLQSHADRYMYVPMVGLSMMVAWSAADIVERWPRSKVPVAVAGAIACVACAVLSFKQISYWNNSGTLYTHTIQVTGENWLAEANLAEYIMWLPGGIPDAIEHLQVSLRLRANNPWAENNMGLALERSDRCADAIPYFEGALRDRPTLVESANNLAMCLVQNNEFDRAVEMLRNAIRVSPAYPDVHFNLASALSQMPGREMEAVTEYETGLHLRPKDPLGHERLGDLLVRMGRTSEGASHLDLARKYREEAATPEFLK
jgi:Tfp pilus assembly protein PilF